MMLYNLLFSLFISCGNSAQDKQGIAFDHYVIKAATKGNVKEVDYLYNHFKKRAEEGIVLKQGQDKIPTDVTKVQFIEVAIDKNLDADYEISRKDNTITLKANSRKTLYWLYYQYFQALSENNSEIKADDLPPAVVNFKDSKKVKFAFNYREPHLKANLIQDYDVILNTNTVEKDWGIWGHQLFNIINKNPADEYYSTINGQLNKNQLCFGKEAMYDFLENFVVENFGEGNEKHQKFVICPADNNLVCTCSECTKLGNEKGNSSFAVMTLLYKLAVRFPNHQFFTTDYLSVKTPPDVVLPENIGVLISSINIPRKAALDPNNKFVKEFVSKVETWGKVCSNVYVWDYVANFDDYLTPFATLSVCKTNFEFYKKLNVKGIFANGAGYDYSTFNEVHTYVLAALMQDPYLDVSQLVNRFCSFYYGKSGHLVAKYILQLEHEMQTNKHSLDLYNGVRKMTRTFLNKKDLFDFYTEIGALGSGETEEIDFKFSQLHTGLAFTALQINLANGFDERFGFAKKQNNQVVINSDFRDNFALFENQFKTREIFLTREKNGMVLNFLNDVKKEVIDVELKHNLMAEKGLKVTSKLDEDYPDSSILMDGIPALSFDYHNGWLLVSGTDLVAEIAEFSDSGLFRLKFNFLLDEHLKLRAPEKIQIIINSVLIQTLYPALTSSESAQRIELETPVNLKSKDKIVIVIYRDETYKKFACDEIYLYK